MGLGCMAVAVASSTRQMIVFLLLFLYPWRALFYALCCAVGRVLIGAVLVGSSTAREPKRNETSEKRVYWLRYTLVLDE